MIEAWLAELSVITAKRQDDDMTESLRLRVYTERLVPYPADIVRHALLGVTWHFWPTWDALKRYCDKQNEERQALVRALDRPGAYPSEQMAESESQVGEEERARVAKGIGDLAKDLREKLEASRKAQQL